MKKRVAYENFISEAEKKNKERIAYVNSRGNNVIVRRHHLTNKIEKTKKRYKEFIKDVSQEIKEKAGSRFFNPYRQSGVYFGCVQSLFMLGSNEWFPYKRVEEMMEKVMTDMLPDKKGMKPWEKFKGKATRENVVKAKDLMGRIEHNMRVLQRVEIDKEVNPYGYKLSQACACIDIKVDIEGLWFFRLNTQHQSEKNIKPLYIKIKKGKEIETEDPIK